MFPVPDTNEGVAEFGMMMREWIKPVAMPNLVVEAAV